MWSDWILVMEAIINLKLINWKPLNKILKRSSISYTNFSNFSAIFSSLKIQGKGVNPGVGKIGTKDWTKKGRAKSYLKWPKDSGFSRTWCGIPKVPLLPNVVLILRVECNSAACNAVDVPHYFNMSHLFLSLKKEFYRSI